MTLRAALAPLSTGATYRRGVFLLLGGVLLLPYLLLVTVFAEMLRTDEVPRPAVLLLIAVATAIAAVPLFLRGTRALEIAARVRCFGPRTAGSTPGATAMSATARPTAGTGYR
ncbi:hypothetical protein ACQEVC_02395 [Plantactinospora sp. CA-294935]|uniref:hypothetical protein n=1 Tax=Plantactinospora sp. CA-294935 TaxID=3240012 RepID=UPI003D8EA926